MTFWTVWPPLVALGVLLIGTGIYGAVRLVREREDPPEPLNFWEDDKLP